MAKRFCRVNALRFCDRNYGYVSAVSLVVMIRDRALVAHAKQVLNKEIEAEGLIVLAWRVIPTNVDALGEIALQSMPAFEQIIVNCPMGVTEVEFNRKLFLARRRAEQLLVNDTSFYVTTLCSTVISYKGL